MNVIRNVRLTALALVLAAVAAFSTAAPAHAAEGDTFAAIAFAPSTGSAGYAYNASSQAAAELDALIHCHGDDAQVVVTVQNGYAALAVAEDGSYGYAWGLDPGDRRTARAVEMPGRGRRPSPHPREHLLGRLEAVFLPAQSASEGIDRPPRSRSGLVGKGLKRLLCRDPIIKWKGES